MEREHLMIFEMLREHAMECTGCGACINICPVNAIKMKSDIRGFLYPSVYPERCIHCDKCKETCPVLNFERKKDGETACYALVAEDEVRDVSSSGGAFSVLAKAVLEENGIVFGAAMEDDLTVHHKVAHNEEELTPLRKSKYVQSDTGYTFRDVKAGLNEGRKVLFVGCPCQVAGLKSYLGEAPENLWTVDLICHGVPSAQMLRDSLEGEGDIAAVDFRDKDYGWESLGMTAIRKNGSRRRFSYNESRYEQGFHPNMTLRESCYNCPFCDFPRQGDLSMGDFWSIGTYREELADGKGISAVLVNNGHGAKLLARARPYIKTLEEATIDWLEGNRIRPEILRPREREIFLRLYPEKPFNEAVLYAQQNKHDIGIVGNWSYPNYGTELTYYALYRVLCGMGYTVTMLSWPKSAQWKPYERAMLFKEDPYPVWDVAEIPERRLDLYQYNDRCHTFVLGSDQLLNNNLYHAFDRFAQMDWVKVNRRKIAYAASFGTDHIWGSDDDRAEMSYFLRRFDYFSSREASGAELLRQYYGRDAQTVLDPVFLLPEAEYETLIRRGAERAPKDPYLFAYVLDQTKEKLKELQECGKWLELPLRTVSDAAPQEHQIGKQQIDTEYGVYLEEWLAYVAFSDAVITDSFHGTCMAILLNKPFLAISNDARGATRFQSLLEILGIEERLCDSVAQLREKRELLRRPMDREQIMKRLDAEREKSVRWLKEALTKPLEQKELSAYDLLGERCCEAADGIYECRERLSALEREAAEADSKQWEQLEDHRLRLDGLDGENSAQNARLELLERLHSETAETDSKQWEQLEDHRLRLDGLDGENSAQNARLELLERLHSETAETDSKQWEQLEDHTLRLNGLDDRSETQSVRLEEHERQLLKLAAEFAQRNEELENQLNGQKWINSQLEQRLKAVERRSLIYRIKSLFGGEV